LDNMGSEKDFSIKKIKEHYVNYFKVGFRECVFSLDFGQYNPEGKEADLYCRIITSPKYAKVLCNILQESLEEYEKNHEIINDED
jgi:hypothetical protein